MLRRGTQHGTHLLHLCVAFAGTGPGRNTGPGVRAFTPLANAVYLSPATLLPQTAIVKWREGLVQRTRVDVASVLILDDAREHVLLVQDNGYWTLPGGKREVGEMLEQTAVREAREETGFDVTLAGIIHVSERFIREDHTLFVTFRGTIIGGQLGSSDPEIGTIVWKTIAETERLVPYYRDIRGLYDRTAQYQAQSEYNRG
jgi:8-oxo-dGTP diphosphatase